jgi:hypothetical protein
MREGFLPQECAGVRTYHQKSMDNIQKKSNAVTRLCAIRARETRRREVFPVQGCDGNWKAIEQLTN